MSAESKLLGIVFDTRFEWMPRKTNGFQLTLTDQKSGDVLFDKQMILYTLSDAVYAAASEVWRDKIEKDSFWELPSYVVMELGLDPYDDDEDD